MRKNSSVPRRRCFWHWASHWRASCSISIFSFFPGASHGQRFKAPGRPGPQPSAAGGAHRLCPPTTLAAAILALSAGPLQKSSRSCAILLPSIWQFSFFWGTLAAFFPASGFSGLLQRFMRLFLPSRSWRRPCSPAALLALPLPAKWVVPASAVCFLLLGQAGFPCCGSAY